MLTFVNHYIPSFRSGGPVRTIKNMSDHLGDKIDFRIVCMDRDAGINEKPFDNIFYNKWNIIDNEEV